MSLPLSRFALISPWSMFDGKARVAQVNSVALQKIDAFMFAITNSDVKNLKGDMIVT